jgi:copper transport protein
LAGAGFALAASGHAAAASPQELMRPAVWLHAVAVALWVGSLYPLRVLLRGDGRVVLRRFSQAIPWLIAVLLVSGIVLAVVQLARVNALWTTNYGWILCIKLFLVGLLLGLAAINRFWLTAEVERGDAVARTQMRYSIALEIVLVVLIFAVAAGWRFTPPPRSIPQEPQAEFVHFHSGKLMADLVLRPGRAGRSSGEIMIRDEQYRPMAPKELTLIFSQPASGIEPMRHAAVSIGDNRWRIDDVVLPAAGRWRLRIDVLINDFEKVSLEDDILIRP